MILYAVVSLLAAPVSRVPTSKGLSPGTYYTLLTINDSLLLVALPRLPPHKHTLHTHLRNGDLRTIFLPLAMVLSGLDAFGFGSLL